MRVVSKGKCENRIRVRAGSGGKSENKIRDSQEVGKGLIFKDEVVGKSKRSFFLAFSREEFAPLMTVWELMRRPL